jgi:type II secretory pathway predicted ATPase ExeA
MKLGVLAALDQRIALRYTMPPMTPHETHSYLRHHLTLAGRTDTLFSDDATTLIHQTSRGYPRAINNLALQAPIAAFSTYKTIVDETSTRAAIAEVTTEWRWPHRGRPASSSPGGTATASRLVVAHP